MLEAPPGPSPQAREAFNAATKARESRNYAAALAAYDKVLELDPNHFDALHDKAWILATHRDPAVRNPKQALELAMRASTNLAKWGLLRKDKDTYSEMASTGRNMLIMGTIAGALAADGKFRSAPRELEAGSAAMAERQALQGSMDLAATSDGASAIAVQGFAVDSAREMNRRFPQIAETKLALDRAEALMNMYKAGKPPTGEEPVAWSTTFLSRLR
jgi:tetratricopeptide (TPR) repeat protein